MSTMTSAHPTSDNSMFFENLSVGGCVQSGYRTITQDMIVAFATLSGDQNPLHLDDEFARTTKFRGIIAHGALILSVVTGLAAQMGIAKLEAFFTEITWYFLRPVRPGDSISVRVEVVSLKPAPHSQSGQLATFRLTVENQRSKIVQHGLWNAIIAPRILETKVDVN